LFILKNIKIQLGVFTLKQNNRIYRLDWMVGEGTEVDIKHYFVEMRTIIFFLG